MPTTLTPTIDTALHQDYVDHLPAQAAKRLLDAALARRPDDTRAPEKEVLLALYNTDQFPLRLTCLGFLRDGGFEDVMVLLQAWHGGKEPHVFFTNGSQIFSGMAVDAIKTRRREEYSVRSNAIRKALAASPNKENARA